MNIKANNPNLVSWVDVSTNSDFSIQNLPFGVFKPKEESYSHMGVAIGIEIVDLKALHILGYLDRLPFKTDAFEAKDLNKMMKYGKQAVRELRNRISDLLDKNNPELQSKTIHVNQILINQDEVEMLLPVKIGDYTDFYSSEQHAYNVGCLFRDPENALMPNWKHIPVGYHGRASSIIPSGQSIYRPKGQIKPPESESPIFSESKSLDFELETAFITFDGKPLGESISTKEADEYIFGMVLLNDWSARDIQAWEYVPLGPFLGKNFASSMSPWVVTLDALEPFRTSGPTQEPKVLPYLEYEGDKHLDINLEMIIQPEGQKEVSVCKSNYKHMYWNMNQQLAHHTINGCNIRCGDAMGSGTISGNEEGSYGSMLEITCKGTKPLKMPDGTERKFINDNETVIMRGFSEKNGIRVGFGEVKTKVLPAK
jgi:fumarylacetoacetase